MMYEAEKRSGLSQKERVRRRIHTQIDQENYTFFPAKEPRDFFGESSRLSVAVYARVSTGNVEQTSSYELQKKYYEDYVRRHPNWTLARIHADEGISGTSLAHREQFHQMITDCKAGKIDPHQKRLPLCQERGGLHQHRADVGGTSFAGGRVF